MNIAFKDQLKQFLGVNIGAGPDMDDRHLRILLLIGKGLFWDKEFFNRAECLASDVQMNMDNTYHVGMGEAMAVDSSMRTDYPYNWTPGVASKVPDKKKNLIWIGEAAYDWDALADVVEMLGVGIWRISDLLKLVPKLEGE